MFGRICALFTEHNETREKALLAFIALHPTNTGHFILDVYFNFQRLGLQPNIFDYTQSVEVWSAVLGWHFWAHKSPWIARQQQYGGWRWTMFLPPACQNYRRLQVRSVNKVNQYDLHKTFVQVYPLPASWVRYMYSVQIVMHIVPILHHSCVLEKVCVNNKA